MLLFQIFRCPWFLISVLVPCYGSLQPGFSKLQRGHRLDRKLIQSFTEVSFLDCVIECLVTPRCKSVNYYKGANFCEINYENKTTAETRYMESAGWVYSEKEHWPQELAGACSNSTCGINQTCKHKRYSQDKFFECVLSDCGIPDLKGIDLNTTRREDAIGIHRRIHASCADGYSQSGSGRLNCQSNGEWKSDIVCEDLSNQLRNVTVTVGLTESEVNNVCGLFAGPGTTSQLVVIICPTSPQGRFVKISQRTEPLTLCEVDVFGVPVIL
ncbi:uncharacterized protein LOC128160396 [Crassostrea angulata]|uniref:uncharacterized protein LOC128160396 n=1 Tax=Magallana angulata TaxID=2784310 RepID=UPI0022B19848|nr:uncharacterized protein LOC128160396 [Crassostrea angulata]